MSNITGTLLLSRKKNINQDTSVDTVKKSQHCCPILYKLKLDHNFIQVLDGIEDWVPNVCVLDLRNNMIAGENALYFMFHLNFLAELYFQGNDFYYKGIEKRISQQCPFLEIICGEKFAKLAERYITLLKFQRANKKRRAEKIYDRHWASYASRSREDTI